MDILLAIGISFLSALTLIPAIIRIARSINVLDRPDKRKIHSVSTPSMGGIAIFVAIFLAAAIAIPMESLAPERYFIGASILVFLLGIRDDLSSLQARHKLVIQLFSAFLVVNYGGVKVEGLEGLFGIYHFPWYFDEFFSIFIIVVLTNAFNLIDGIDGLAGGVSFIISLVMSWVFYQSGDLTHALIGVSIAGASLSFLLFNWYPSKIFMGDTGSMLMGFMLTVLMIQMLTAPIEVSVLGAPIAVSFALLLLPIYDTLRVIMIRIFTGRPPLSPDRNHIHHVLLKLGYNHAQASIALLGYNTLMIVLTLSLQELGELWLVLSMSVFTIAVGMLLDRKLVRRENHRLKQIVPPEIKISDRA